SGATNYTVNKASTTTGLSALPNPATFGQTLNLTAPVPRAGATGTMTFSAGNTNLGTANLSNGTASLSTPGRPVGTHGLTASYNGDANTHASVSATFNETVNSPAKAVSSTTLSASPNPSTPAQPVTLTATVLPAAATGTVTFSDGNDNLGTVNL